MKRLASAAIVAVIVLLSGCLAPVTPPAEAYTLTASVSGDAGTGVTVAVTDEGSGTGLSTTGPTTAVPVTTEYNGSYATGELRTVSVQIDATGVPSAGALGITVTLTDESHNPPVTYTLDEYILENGSSAAADLRYLKVFTLPPQ